MSLDAVITPKQARLTVGAMSVALGVAGWLFPRATARAFGVDDEANPALRFLARFIAVRNVTMGLGILEHEDDSARTLEYALATTAVDAVATVAATSRGILPKRSAVIVLVTVGALGVLTHAARREG